MKTPERFLRRMFIIVPLMFVTSILLVAQQDVSPEQPIPIPTNPEATAEVTSIPIDTSLYEPSHYNIPDTIAGYKVVAVISSENTECYPDGIILLKLQVPDLPLDPSDLSPTITSLSSVREAVYASGIPKLTWGTVYPDATLESLVRANESWNQARRLNGCMKLGRPSDDENDYEAVPVEIPTGIDIRLAATPG